MLKDEIITTQPGGAPRDTIEVLTIELEDAAREFARADNIPDEEKAREGLVAAAEAYVKRKAAKR